MCKFVHVQILMVERMDVSVHLKEGYIKVYNNITPKQKWILTRLTIVL
jgi:hypothetical protein